MKVEISAEKSFHSQPLDGSAPLRLLPGCTGSNVMVTEVRKTRKCTTAQRGHYGNQVVRNRKCMDQDNEGIQKDMKHQALNCLGV